MNKPKEPSNSDGVEMKPIKMPEAPPEHTEPWLASTIGMCERVYQDTSNIRIYSGVFSRFRIGIDELPEGTEILPGANAWVFVRVQTSHPKKMPWMIITRVKSWGGEKIHRATVVAKGDLNFADDHLDHAEFFFRYPSPGFNLTHDRLNIVNKVVAAKKPLEVLFQVELWIADSFRCAQRLAFTYDIRKVVANERAHDGRPTRSER